MSGTGASDARVKAITDLYMDHGTRPIADLLIEVEHDRSRRRFLRRELRRPGNAGSP